jgi:hypothetical protein
MKRVVPTTMFVLCAVLAMAATTSTTIPFTIE